MSKPINNFRCLLHGAVEVVSVVKEPNVYFLKGSNMRNVEVLRAKRGSGYSVVVDCQGKIVAIDEDSKIAEEYRRSHFEQVLDCSGKTLMPGLVDAHSHPVWAGDRVHEFAMKLAGATYMEIHKAGGGIHFTVEKTREASEEELFLSFKNLTKELQKLGWKLSLGVVAKTKEKEDCYGNTCANRFRLIGYWGWPHISQSLDDVKTSFKSVSHPSRPESSRRQHLQGVYGGISFVMEEISPTANATVFLFISNDKGQQMCETKAYRLIVSRTHNPFDSFVEFAGDFLEGMQTAEELGRRIDEDLKEENVVECLEGQPKDITTSPMSEIVNVPNRTASDFGSVKKQDPNQRGAKQEDSHRIGLIAGIASACLLFVILAALVAFVGYRSGKYYVHTSRKRIPLKPAGPEHSSQPTSAKTSNYTQMTSEGENSPTNLYQKDTDSESSDSSHSTDRSRTRSNSENSKKECH